MGYKYTEINNVNLFIGFEENSPVFGRRAMAGATRLP